MIIYTNDGNPLLLKLLISANVAGQKIDVKKIAFSGKTNTSSGI